MDHAGSPLASGLLMTSSLTIVSCAPFLRAWISSPVCAGLSDSRRRSWKPSFSVLTVSFARLRFNSPNFNFAISEIVFPELLKCSSLIESARFFTLTSLSLNASGVNLLNFAIVYVVGGVGEGATFTGWSFVFISSSEIVTIFPSFIFPSFSSHFISPIASRYVIVL